MAMPYKDPKDAIKTREENGYRVSLVDPNHKFPTEATLKAAIDRVNDLAANHEMKPCPAGQECLVCFMTKASAESDVLGEYTEKTFHALFEKLGPLAHIVADYHTFFSMAFFFLLVGQEIGKGPRDASTDISEIDALNKLFQLGDLNKPASGEEKLSN